jgi:hypothetical protein
MLGQPSTQHPFHQPDLDFPHQALIARQIVCVLNATQQLV